MTIQEVGKKYGLTNYTLRYYENAKIIPPIQRTNGIRNYTDLDCRWIAFMKCMRDAGVQVDVLAKYFELVQYGESTRAERKQILLDQKKMVEEKIKVMQQSLDKLNRKINNFDTSVKRVEDELLEELEGRK